MTFFKPLTREHIRQELLQLLLEHTEAQKVVHLCLLRGLDIFSASCSQLSELCDLT